MYIQKVKLNGKEYTKNYISHDDIMNGGIIEFEMGNSPNMTWGVDLKDCPPALIK